MLTRTKTSLRGALSTALLCLATSSGANDEHLRLPEVRSVAEIPGTFNMIEDGTGRHIIVSANTRYVFKSFELIDTWHDNVEITSTSQLQALAQRVQPSMIPVDLMFSIAMPGDAKVKPMFAYVDPNEESSMAFIREAKAKSIPVVLFVVPFGNGESNEKALKLSCGMQAGEHALVLSSLVNNSYKALINDPDCKDHHKLRANVITARTIGVNGTPFVISGDGRMFRGLPPDITSFAGNQ